MSRAKRAQSPPHPGSVLVESYLTPRRITQRSLALHLDVPVQRINEIVRGKRAVTPQTAWLLSMALETTPVFWMNLQSVYDLHRLEPPAKIAPLRGRRDS